MTFKDYFSKNFETSDNHHIQTLKTHYYNSRKEDAIGAVLEVMKEMKCINKNVDEEHGEIIVDASSFSGTITITATAYTEMAIDIQVMTYNILPTAKGKKVIEEIYSLIDKKLSLKGIALHSR